MTTLTPRALARWQWLPGMRGFTRHGHPFRISEGSTFTTEGCTPDLDDPVTAASMLLVVRTCFPGAWAEPNGAPEWDGADEAERDRWWAVYVPGRGRLWASMRISAGPTEVKALAAALDGVP